MSRVWTWRQAILESRLPATTKHVLMVISTHMNDMGEGCYPSTKRVSFLSSLSERAVCEHIGNAVQAGWLISKVHGFNGQGWARNEYQPSWPKGTDFDAEGADAHAEGTDFDDKKALTDGQSNIPVKHSKEHSIVKKKATKNAKPLITLEQYLGDNEQKPDGWPDCGDEWQRFCNYYIGKQTKWADWKRCWLNWISDKQGGSQSPTSGATRQGGAGSYDKVAAATDRALFELFGVRREGYNGEAIQPASSTDPFGGGATPFDADFVDAGEGDGPSLQVTHRIGGLDKGGNV